MKAATMDFKATRETLSDQLEEAEALAERLDAEIGALALAVVLDEAPESDLAGARESRANAAAKVAEMTNQLLTGQTVDVNDTTTYDNGVKVVPSYLLPVVSVTKDNVTQALVDTGYYTAAQIAN